MHLDKSSPSAKHPSHKRSFSSILLRLGLVLILLVALAECVLRFGLGLGNPVMVIPDAACSYILKPDQSMTRFFARNSVNHYGMRSDPIPPTKDPHTARIFFVGDSITYGTSRIDQDKIFTERIHHDLPAMLGAPVEVLNASASAWGIDNELGYIQSRGLFQSDLLVLVLNTGDPSQTRATIENVGEGLETVKPLFALQELWDRYLRKRIFHTATRIDAGDTPTENPVNVRHNLAQLDQLKRETDQQHIGFVVVYVPFRTTLDPGSSLLTIAHQAHEDLEAWSKSSGVPLIDLTPVELQHSTKEITLEGIHLNAKGHEIAAEEIEKSLVSLHNAHKILQQFP